MDRLHEIQLSPYNSNHSYQQIETTNNDNSNDDLHTLKEIDKKIRSTNNDIHRDIENMNHEIGKLISIVDENKKKIITDDINKYMYNIDCKMKTIKRLIEQLKTERKKFVDDKDNITKLRMIDNFINFSINKLSETAKYYLETKNSYDEKIRNKVRRQLNIVDKEKYSRITDGEINQMIQEGRTKVFVPEIYKDIQERHTQILELERSIVELHQLFTDMAVLVNVQGEIIDSIEMHVSKADTYIEKGVDQLKEANTLQKKSRKKKCFILICCMMIILIIMVVSLSVFKKN